MQKRKLIKRLKIILPLLLGIFLIVFSISEASPEERHKLYSNITNADPVWIFCSALCGILAHISRAYRWKFMLNAMGYYPKFKNRFMALMAGYLANLGIPRSGEILRGASIATYEEVSFEKAFGTIISERVADIVMLLLIMGLTIIINSNELFLFFEENNINPFVSLLIIVGLIIAGLLFIKILQKSSNRFLVKLKNFALGVLEGIKSIFNMKKNLVFIAHTLFIWAMYLLTFYLMKFAIPTTVPLPLNAIMVAFVVGSFAISITNGGIGVFPIAVGAILIFFGIDKESGEAFGWIVWGTQTLSDLIIGGLSMLFLPILNRKITMVKRE